MFNSLLAMLNSRHALRERAVNVPHSFQLSRMPFSTHEEDMTSKASTLHESTVYLFILHRNPDRSALQSITRINNPVNCKPPWTAPFLLCNHVTPVYSFFLKICLVCTDLFHHALFYFLYPAFMTGVIEQHLPVTKNIYLCSSTPFIHIMIYFEAMWFTQSVTTKRSWNTY